MNTRYENVEEYCNDLTTMVFRIVFLPAIVSVFNMIHTTLTGERAKLFKSTGTIRSFYKSLLDNN